MSAVSTQTRLADPDRIGVAASILCAIHCAVAPVLLLSLPAFGRIWAHPASHALVAVLVIPLAIFAIRKGFRRHRNRLVASIAGIGILLIIAGAAAPAFTPAQETPTGCDKCCPSTHTTAAGETSLHIPPAAIITTLGGIALILAHLANLRCCHACKAC